MQPDLLPLIETHDEPVSGANLPARLAELKQQKIHVEWMTAGRPTNACYILHYHRVPLPKVFAREPVMVGSYDSRFGF